MAHKKAGGSSRNGRDSAGKRLGVKLYGGQAVKSGCIIVTQRGTKMLVSRDHSIQAVADGVVKFDRKAEGRVMVSVDPRPVAAPVAAE